MVWVEKHPEGHFKLAVVEDMGHSIMLLIVHTAFLFFNIPMEY